MRSIADLQPKIGRPAPVDESRELVQADVGYDPEKRLASVGGRIRQQSKLEVKEQGNQNLDIERVVEILRFLIVPGVFMGAIVLLNIPMPKVMLYGIAGAILGMIILRAREQPEIMLAVTLLYLPFAKLYAVSILPLVNGTNIFIVLCLFFAFVSARQAGQSFWPTVKGRNLVLCWWILSCGSIATLVFTPGALSFVIGHELPQATAWIAQAGFYVAAIGLVRTPGQAKRMAIYSMIGTLLVVGLGAREWIDKRGSSSIEKSRVGGTFDQPNDYGGFLAFTMLPIIAVLLFNMKNIRAWLLAPYLYLSLKVLIATFSRGAYVALAFGGMALSYFRGVRFTIIVGTLSIAILVAFPSLIPESIMARMEQTLESSNRGNQPGQLDKSTEHRFIMWEAAGSMIAESPILGKGFKAFPYLKERYTRKQVNESDPHNMYLYVASQMGLPAVFVFLAIKVLFLWMGWQIFRRSKDHFERILGASAVAMVVCIGLINVFGSRMVNLEFTAYFYSYLIIMQVLYTNLLRVESGQGAAVNDPSPGSQQGGTFESKLGTDHTHSDLRSKLGFKLKGRGEKVKLGARSSATGSKVGLGSSDVSKAGKVRVGFNPTDERPDGRSSGLHNPDGKED